MPARRLAAELSREGGVIHVQVRMAPDLHDAIRIAAASRRQSVQAWMLASIRGAVLRQAHDGDKTLAAALDAARGEGDEVVHDRL